MTKGKAPAWRNRIVGTGEEPPDQLLANPRNWRRHPAVQRMALRGSLASVGWVQQVMVNRRTGYVVDGHARVEEALSKGEATVPVLYVDLSEEEEALVLATLDPIGALAERDQAALDALLGEVSEADEELKGLLEKLAGTAWDEKYTADVELPQYQITGENPPPRDLYDATKADALAAEIQAQKLDPEVAAFLLRAAQRHVVFDYGRIAEFYAHAEPELQRLMEASALVIIDLEDAMAYGYVALLEKLRGLREEEE